MRLNFDPFGNKVLCVETLIGAGGATGAWRTSWVFYCQVRKVVSETLSAVDVMSKKA